MVLKRVILVTPVFRRFEMTRLMLEQRVRTFEAARRLGVECGCVVIGDDANLAVAEKLGFHVIEAPNRLGSKYNDGHEFAVNDGWDFSFQVNSDQVFDPELLVALSGCPDDQLIRTVWLSAAYRDGRKFISYRNPLWAMKAYPTKLLESVPRPCQEDAMSMCDSLVHAGVIHAHPSLETHTVVVGPLETIQFESGQQLTPWKRHLYAGMLDSTFETSVPWPAIADIHGGDFVAKMKEFYQA